MRICHIITRLIVGGAQENTLLTCEGLHARGHEVTLISGPETGPEGSLLAAARAGGYRLEIVDALRRAVRLRMDRRARRDLARLLADLAPDVVHTHSSKAGILGRWAARDAGVPVIVHTIHGMSFNRTQPWFVRAVYRLLERSCADYTDAIVTVANAMTDQAVAAGLADRGKFVTVYSGMRTDLFSPGRYDRRETRRAWGVGEDDVVVGTIARLFRNKGYEQLIPAMRYACEREPRLRFVWVGDGAHRARYERWLARLGLRGRVVLTGLVQPEQVPRLLAGMDVLVHASQWEGLPRAVVQALLMEVPAVSFDVDGAPEVINPRTGVLVPLNDTTKLAEAMIELARDATLRAELGRNGREWCLARFDWRAMVDQLEALYNRLAERASENPEITAAKRRCRAGVRTHAEPPGGGA
ncbi:MAG: glycosyltransferase family 4 protein [Phycisphaerae bacterium]|jgi:glycosyltransferase involved in cell wall biosynthesis